MGCPRRACVNVRLGVTIGSKVGAIIWHGHIGAMVKVVKAWNKHHGKCSTFWNRMSGS